MYASTFKPVAGAAALVALLALGACGKKVDDTTTRAVTPAPMSNSSSTGSSLPMSSSASTSSSMGSTETLGSMDTPTVGAGMAPPKSAASAATR